MATKLRNMVITKVALVDEGACSEAHINLIKRRNPTMTFEEIMKSMPEDQKVVIEAEIAIHTTELAKAKEDLATANTEKAAKEKEAEDAKADKAKMEKEATDAKEALANAGKKGEDEEAELFKSASPAIQSLITKMKEQKAAAEALAKRVLEDETNKEAIAKAKTISNIPEKEEEVVGLYKSLKAVDSTLADKVFAVLEKANAVIEKGAAFSEAGSNDPGKSNTDADTAWVAMEKAAEPLVKSRNISKEAAISAIMKEQPELYKNYLNSLER